MLSQRLKISEVKEGGKNGIISFEVILNYLYRDGAKQIQKQKEPIKKKINKKKEGEERDFFFSFEGMEQVRFKSVKKKKRKSEST